MEARVKETGKEFKVRGILTPTADAYAIEEVDLFFDESDQVELLYREDYWERLKHEYAGMAMQGMPSSHRRMAPWKLPSPPMTTMPSNPRNLQVATAFS